MPGLVLPTNVVVPVAIDGAEREFEEIGDRGRTFDGTPFTNVRAYKDNDTYRTAPVSTTLAAAIKSSLSGARPLAVYGNLVGVSSSTTANFHGQLVRETWTQATTARMTVLEFKLFKE